MRKKNLATCLSIAGSDSSCEAGSQADLSAFIHADCIPLVAHSALTAQSFRTIIHSDTVDASFMHKQLKLLQKDYPIDAIKIGMLANEDLVAHAIEFCKTQNCPIICDPVFLSTSGSKLLSINGLKLATDELYPLVTQLTPNIPEAQILTDSKSADPQTLCKKLYQKFSCEIYLKGGHNPYGPAIDYIYDGKTLYKLESPELTLRASRGTGCRLAASLTAHLANGLDFINAAKKAKAFVWDCLNQSIQNRQGQWLMPLRIEESNIDIKVTTL